MSENKRNRTSHAFRTEPLRKLVANREDTAEYYRQAQRDTERRIKDNREQLERFDNKES